MNIGQAIQKCRKLRKYNQAELAEKSGISVSHLCLIEKNNREPSLASVQSIANALEIPLTILILLASENEEISEFDMSHVDTLKKNIESLISDAGLQ